MDVQPANQQNVSGLLVILRTETKKGFNQDLTNEMAVECNSMYVFVS